MTAAARATTIRRHGFIVGMARCIGVATASAIVRCFIFPPGEPSELRLTARLSSSETHALGFPRSGFSVQFIKSKEKYKGDQGLNQSQQKGLVRMVEA